MKASQLKGISLTNKIHIAKLVDIRTWLRRVLAEKEATMTELAETSEMPVKTIDNILWVNKDLTMLEIAKLEIGVGKIISSRIEMLKVKK